MSNPDPHSSGPSGIASARIEANWQAIQIEIDVPRPALPERVLLRLGVPSRITRLAVATPSLRRAWYLAIAGMLVVGLVTIDATAPRQSLLPLLALAPLIPVLGVAMAYGPASDPAFEMQLATPMRGLRIVAIRSLVVLSISAILVTAIASLNRDARPFAAAWILPALAVTSVSVMLMTVVTPRRASMIATAAWLLVVVAARSGTDPLTAFTAPGQLIAGVVALGAGAVTLQRREAFDRLAIGS